MKTIYNMYGYYIKHCLRTWHNDRPRDKQEQLAHLGVLSEVGEVAQLLRKSIESGKPVDKELLYEELGDVCYYVAVLSHLRPAFRTFSIQHVTDVVYMHAAIERADERRMVAAAFKDLDTILDMNMAKREARFPEVFNNRQEEA